MAMPPICPSASNTKPFLERNLLKSKWRPPRMPNSSQTEKATSISPCGLSEAFNLRSASKIMQMPATSSAASIVLPSVCTIPLASSTSGLMAPLLATRSIWAENSSGSQSALPFNTARILPALPPILAPVSSSVTSSPKDSSFALSASAISLSSRDCTGICTSSKNSSNICLFSIIHLRKFYLSPKCLRASSLKK